MILHIENPKESIKKKSGTKKLVQQGGRINSFIVFSVLWNGLCCPKIIYQLLNFQIYYQANRMTCEVTEINEIIRVELWPNMNRTAVIIKQKEMLETLSLSL